VAVRDHIASQESWIVRTLISLYRPLLSRAIHARGFVIAAAVAGLVVAGLTLRLIGTEFLPKLDEGSLWVRGFMPQTISPTEAARLVKIMRETIVRFP
jgi:cobalt-zinc-cadmium resistance protein CzcA